MAGCLQAMELLFNHTVCLLPQTTPTAEEIGYCDEIRVSEIGGTSVTIFKQGTVLGGGTVRARFFKEEDSG